MAGILLSGGTYTSHGDNTASFLYVVNSDNTGGAKSTLSLGSGTLTLSGETAIDYAGEGYTGYVYNLPREADLAGFNQGSGGTILITTTGNTSLYPQYARHWNFHYSGGANQYIIGDLNCSGTITVQRGLVYTNGSSFNNAGTGTVGGCHIISGTMSGTNISPTFNNLRIGTKGTFKSGAGRKITINSTGPSNKGFVNDGTFDASTGIVSFEGQASQIQKIRGQANDFNVVDVSGTSTTTVQGFESGYDDIDIAGALYIHKGKFQTYGDKLHCTGPVVISGGTLDTYTSDDGSSSHRLGSLYIKSAGTYNATSGTTIINKINSDNYKFRNEGGTFTHNSGTVILDLSTDGGFYKNTGSSGKYLYNLTIKNDTTDARVSQHIGDVTVSNNLIVSGAGSAAADWDAGFYNAGDGDIIASGAATMINGAKLGRSIQNGTFGALTIGAKGWYDAGPTTTLYPSQSDFFTLSGTYTHNKGTLVCGTDSSGGYDDFNRYGDVEPVLYNLTRLDDGNPQVLLWGDLTIENLMNNAKANGFKTAGTGSTGAGTQVITMGTATGSGVVSGSAFYLTYTGDPVTLRGASEAYPAIWKASDPTWWHDVTFENVDYQTNIATDGLGTDITTSGNCTFKSVTIAADDSLTTLSGQRVKFDALNITGSIVTSGSLMILDKEMNYDGAGWLGNETTDIMFTGTGATHDFAGQPYKHIMFNGTGEDKLNWTTSFPDTPIIVAGGTFKPDHNVTAGNISIVNGGTWNNDVDVLTLSSGKNFSNRGGLFASSSAVFTDGVKGVSSQYVVKENFTGLSGATAATAEVWFKVDNTKPMDQAGIINPFGNNRWNIIVSSNPVSASGNYRLGFEWDNGGTEIWNSGKVQDWDDTQWHHVAMTIDETDGYKLYFDGKLEASGAALGNEAKENTASVMVGGQTDYGVVNRAFAGTIGRASIWSAALTTTQIRKMMFEDFDTATTTNCKLWWQFDEGEGGTVVDKSGNSNTGTLSGSASNATWANGGTWTAGGKLGSEASVLNGNLYIGSHPTDATVFASSYFTLNNRKLVEGSKFASKSHMGTLGYYIATSGTNDWLNYQKLTGAPIGTASEVYILADGSHRSYFNFDSTANNEQCHLLENAGYIRIINNSDFYTQDFDNSQGVWIKSSTYGGTIHDDGSTPHEYEPIDIMDDLDSPFDVEDLLD